jgi:hypothetical protein
MNDVINIKAALAWAQSTTINLSVVGDVRFYLEEFLNQAEINYPYLSKGILLIDLKMYELLSESKGIIIIDSKYYLQNKRYIEVYPILHNDKRMIFLPLINYGSIEYFVSNIWRNEGINTDGSYLKSCLISNKNHCRPIKTQSQKESPFLAQIVA